MVIILLISLTRPAMAALNYAGFLANGAGVKSAAVSGASIAMADSTDTLFNNVSGLTQLKGTHLSASRSRFYGEVDHTVLAVSQETMFGTFGLGYAAMGVSDLVQTNANGDELGSFNFSDQAMLMGYSLAVSNMISIGFSGKLIQQSAIESKSAMSSDIAVLISAESWSLAVVGQDLIQTAMGQDRQPNRVRMGAMVQLDSVKLEGDIRITEGQAADAQAGAQYTFENLKVLGGVNSQGISAGVQITLDQMSFNYSYRPHQLGDMSQFGIEVSL